ncbi:DNA-processing protein DprA [Peribacillus alkalitolerans]|uniref:DNA-processing protein DprA n=1 Tax=Peribacillus alkalitolerans TaxID=1550385 RepID=UPI0013D8C491|nr:DNA-processing protein DprA [Peribacillus alkalitolerans]
MNDLDKRLIALDHCKKATWKIIQLILQYDEKLLEFPKWTEQKWKCIFPQDTLLHTTSLLQDFHSIKIDSLFNVYHSNHIRCITLFSELYPTRLKNIYNPPWVIYAKGNISLLEDKKVLAIIGSRKPSPYGKVVSESLIPKLIEKNYTVVSGLASGIDGIAHRETMKNGGRTIAVLGGGVFHLYPKENIPLALDMMKDNLVISEAIPFQKPMPWMFPARNRIISGISDGILVIEAKERSGTLITAYHALEQGREVFAVPGNIINPLSTGSNLLIQDGAKLVLNVEDIDNELKNYENKIK